MQKVYERIDWENEPSTNTPINETNLNKMDYALNEVDGRVVTINNVLSQMGTQVSLVLEGDTLRITTVSAIDNGENTAY